MKVKTGIEYLKYLDCCLKEVEKYNLMLKEQRKKYVTREETIPPSIIEMATTDNTNLPEPVVKSSTMEKVSD